MSVLGSLSFISVDKQLIKKIIGVLLIIFVLLKFFNIFTFILGKKSLIALGGITGFISGIAGSAGPLGAAVFLSLNLPPVVYISSEAVTAVVMHVFKTIVYGKYINFDIRIIFISVLMGLAMIGGTWVGKGIIEKIPVYKFKIFVGILLIIISLQMIFS